LIGIAQDVYKHEYKFYNYRVITREIKGSKVDPIQIVQAAAR
jgi:hypothetical protein